jgi:hypothetical protein
MNLYKALIAALVLGSGSLLAACGERPDVSTPAAAPGDRPNARAPITAHIVVQRGQSLRRIAQEYHVEERDIIAACNPNATNDAEDPHRSSYFESPS